MIKKLFNQRLKKSNKRGSMLTLVLVILVMAIILITSAISITNSTRSRYFDYTLTNQARTTCTGVAESFVTAVKTQEILDTELEAMAADHVTASVSGASVPGLNGAGNTSTTVSFSSDSNYIYMDVSTTIGNLTDGTSATENVRVYFKKKDPPAKSQLFNHMMEIGDNASVSAFNIGAGAPAGKDNTVFFHGDADLTKNAGNNMFSDVITTGRVTLGNGGTVQGYMLFAGKDSGIKAFSGSVKFNELYFISTNGQGTMAPTGSGLVNNYIDISPLTDGSPITITTKNFDVNTVLRNGATTYYNAGGTSIPLSNGGDVNNIQNSMNSNAGNTDMDNKAKTLLTKAMSAVDPANAYPTIDQASPMFLQNVDLSELQTRTCPPVPGEHNLLPGVYYLSGSYAGRYNVDCSEGAYIFYVTGNTTISSGCFYIDGGDADDDSQWARFIISPNTTLKIGGYSAGSTPIGILSTEHTSLPGPAVAGTKPTCYIYGFSGSKFTVENEYHMVDAYVGLYGPDSTINITSYNYLYGRFSATKFTSDNANGTNLPYCPGPQDSAASNTKVPKTSDYEVVRFRYYY